VIISVPDRDLIPHAQKDDITVIPNGVDHLFFQPVEHEKIHDLVFIGNMGYPPNVDAAVYLIEKILPLVRYEYPAVTVLLAGASPHARVKALASEAVRVTGWVDDIRDCYAGGRMFIAPLQIGTGLQNKLLEAMAMKLPCITTPLANSALGARENEEILVGSTPTELAGHVITLLKDNEKALQLSLKGRQFVIDNYSWERNTRKLEEIIMNTKNEQS
jgi:glycosyltransferase involved in cell wall biosynthesis